MPINEAQCKALADSILKRVKELSEKNTLQSGGAGEQLYAVLAAACLEKRESVALVFMSHMMLVMAQMQPNEENDGKNVQNLLLKHLGERGSSLRALGGDLITMPMTSAAIKNVHTRFVQSNALPQHAKEAWPASTVDDEMAKLLKASAARLMAMSSSDGISFRTTLDSERMSWDVMMAPFAADADETVQGSMRKLVLHSDTMMDYEKLVDWCSYAAADDEEEEDDQEEQQEEPQGAALFVDTRDERDAEFRNVDAIAYDKDLLAGRLKAAERKLAIQYGFGFILVNATADSDWATELKKNHQNKLFHKGREQQMSAARVLSLARINCPLPATFLDGSSAKRIMDQATEDLLYKLNGGKYSISPYVVWKKVACGQHPPPVDDDEITFSPRKILSRGAVDDNYIFEFRDEWLDMAGEGSVSFDLFFAVSPNLCLLLAKIIAI